MGELFVCSVTIWLRNFGPFLALNSIHGGGDDDFDDGAADDDDDGDVNNDDDGDGGGGSSSRVAMVLVAVVLAAEWSAVGGIPGGAVMALWNKSLLCSAYFALFIHSPYLHGFWTSV